MSISDSDLKQIIGSIGRSTRDKWCNGRDIVDIISYNINYLSNERLYHVKKATEYQERIYKCRLCNSINILETLRKDVLIKYRGYQASLVEIINYYKFSIASNTDEFDAINTIIHLLKTYGYLPRENNTYIMGDLARENPRIFQMLASEYYKLYKDKIISITDSELKNIKYFIRRFKYMEAEIAISSIGFDKIKTIKGCGKVTYKFITDYYNKSKVSRI